MSNNENMDVIFRWFDALNRGNIDQLNKLADEIFTTDFTWHDPRMLDFEAGPAGAKKFIRQVLIENCDVHVTVEDIFSYGDKTAYRFTVSMTDAASGKPVNVQLLAIDRFLDGQIAEEWQLSTPGNW